MNKIDTKYLDRCILALDTAFLRFKNCSVDEIEYEIYRSAIIKVFEIVLEQSGKLLKKVLKSYFHTNKEVDKLIFKDIFRHAGLYDILDILEVERWLNYRDHKNNTSHGYGAYLADETLVLIPQFIIDAKKLSVAIQDAN